MWPRRIVGFGIGVLALLSFVVEATPMPTADRGDDQVRSRVASGGVLAAFGAIAFRQSPGGPVIGLELHGDRDPDRPVLPRRFWAEQSEVARCGWQQPIASGYCLRVVTHTRPTLLFSADSDVVLGSFPLAPNVIVRARLDARTTDHWGALAQEAADYVEERIKPSEFAWSWQRVGDLITTFAGTLVAALLVAVMLVVIIPPVGIPLLAIIPAAWFAGRLRQREREHTRRPSP